MRAAVATEFVLRCTGSKDGELGLRGDWGIDCTWRVRVGVVDGDGDGDGDIFGDEDVEGCVDMVVNNIDELAT